ncbi:MAG: hypothetical protein HQ507_06785 [Candidatus Marinimicrobia bacterium]|nr:hypothetical protein [Candidatus Neomarinimicrobiota bacterium]
MVSQEVKDIAQKLVDNTIERKKLEEESKDLKYGVVGDAMDGPIQCSGGSVYFRDAQERYLLDKEKLRGELRTQFHLSASQIDKLIEDSKSMSSALPTVMVKLD